jgi:hypothetical protein
MSRKKGRLGGAPSAHRIEGRYSKPVWPASREFDACRVALWRSSASVRPLDPYSPSFVRHAPNRRFVLVVVAAAPSSFRDEVSTSLPGVWIRDVFPVVILSVGLGFVSCAEPRLFCLTASQLALQLGKHRKGRFNPLILARASLAGLVGPLRTTMRANS